VPSPSPSHAQPLGDVEGDDNDSFDSDAGVPKLWDPHVGLKPSEVDGQVSDDEVEIDGNLLYGGDKEVNSMMVNMMVELGDCDEHDEEWLPEKERKKLEARKKGNVSFRDANVRNTYHVIRKEEEPLPRARCCLQVGTNVAMAQTCSCNEEPNTTHRALVHQVLILVTPPAIASLI